MPNNSKRHKFVKQAQNKAAYEKAVASLPDDITISMIKKDDGRYKFFTPNGNYVNSGKVTKLCERYVGK